MTIQTMPKTTNPWYREPWPWILIGLPASVVVAGIVTLVIAIRHEDGLVAEDYYKQGLAINRVLERESRAAQLGLKAELMFSDDRMRIRLLGTATPSNELVARFIHPVRSGEDRDVALRAVAPGWYEARLPVSGGQRWRIQLEDAEATWRLSGVWTRDAMTLTLGADAPSNN